MALTPSLRMSSESSALTLAWVATGMKAGVSTSPRGVLSTPARAGVSLSWARTLRGIGRRFYL